MSIIFPKEQKNLYALLKFFNNLRHFYDAILFWILKSCLKYILPFILLLKLLIKSKIYLSFKNTLNMHILHINADLAH